ncbi:hypothetical protein F4814DRAFT_223065 [Daldinia grandis]|nr:hypothetical protein F4814DRAFT_223065 [Daldinia grandis]
MSRRESQSTDAERLLPIISRALPLNHHSIPSEEVLNNTASSNTSIADRPGRPPRRFWKRTLTLIIFPLAITAYYFVIWLHFGRDPDDPVKYGSASEIRVFYSWFIISVFALEWSKYGLAGVESAMLQTPFWQVPNAVALMMHSESPWSGPDGWFKCLQWFGRPQKSLVHRLWSLLAILSLLVYVAVPLSGLSFETSDGYVPSSVPPMVIGHTWEDYNLRQMSFYYDGALKAWEIGSPATIPGFGLIYTPEYVQREQYSGLKSVRNTLPLDDGIPEILLAPQASTPVSGKVWGLRAGYNCSMVKDASEFTILNQKSVSSYNSRRDTVQGQDQLAWVRLETPSRQQHIYIFNTSSNKVDANNLWGYVEMGVTVNPTEGEADQSINGTGSNSSSQDGVSKVGILEYSLWQATTRGAYHNYSDFNSTLDPVIKGMGHPLMQTPNGTFVTNNTFFNSSEYDLDIDPPIGIISLAPPIGIRCRAVSDLGTAELNPMKSTFHSFKQTPDPPVNAENETPRLGTIARETMLGRYSQIFTAINSPAPIADSNSYLYRSYIQPQMLRKSIMLAFATDALQLMYDGTYGFEGAWMNPNMTSSKPGKVLVTGTIPQNALAVCFAVWSVACTLLGVLYGFRQRWSDSLDGYSLFRFGVELADEVKDKPDFWNATEFHQSKTLETLPGLTKDMRSKRGEGHQSVKLNDMIRHT